MNIFDKIDKIAAEVIKRKFSGITEKDISAEMEEILEKTKKHLILKALGITYNKWDNVYEPNSYSGLFNKVVEQYHRSKLEKIAADIYTQVFGNESLKIYLSEKDKAHFRKTYKDQYKESLDEMLTELAINQAKIDAEKYFKEYLGQEEQESSE